MTSSFVRFLEAIGGTGTSVTNVPVGIPFLAVIPAGDLLTVASFYVDLAAPITGVSDTQGNTYTFRTVQRVSGSVVVDLEVWDSVLTHPLTNADTITVTYTATSNNKLVVVGQITGLSASPFDKTAKTGVVSPANGSLSIPATAATTQANEMVVSCYGTYAAGGGGSFTAGSGFTTEVDYFPGTFIHLFMEYKNVSFTGTQASTATLSVTPDVYAGVTVTYKDGAGKQPRHPAVNFQNPGIL